MTTKDICKVLLMAIFGACLIFTTYATLQVLKKAGRAIDEVAQASSQLKVTAQRIDRVAEVYEEQLSSERSRKAIQASIEAAAAWKATAFLVNTTVVPQINKTLKELERTSAGLTATSNSLNSLVEDQNGNLSRVGDSTRESIQSITRVAEKLGVEVTRVGSRVDTIGSSIEQTVTKLDRTGEEVNGTMVELRRIAEQLRLASESAPATARSIEQIAHSTSKWQSALRVIQIVATLGVLLK